MNKAFGLLADLVNDPEVSEVCVDGPSEIYYSSSKGIIEFDKTFKKEADLLKVIHDLAQASSKKLTGLETSFFLQPSPLVTVFVTLPPVAINGPTMNIMKIPEKHLSLRDLIKYEALEEKGFDLLQELIQKDNSFIVAGITGSGKTTLMNCMLQEVPEAYRMITIERNHDLIIKRKRTVRLISSLQDAQPFELIRISREMRPDYLVCSYLDQDEAWELIKILRDGYTGMACMTAEDIFDAVKRLEVMVLASNPHFSLETVRYSICQAFKYIVFQAWGPQRKRQVSDIAELVWDEGKIKVKSLYKRAQ